MVAVAVLRLRHCCACFDEQSFVMIRIVFGFCVL